jgi:hypothetical protein
MAQKTTIRRLSLVAAMAVGVAVSTPVQAIASQSFAGLAVTQTQWDGIAAVVEANPDVFSGVSVDPATGIGTIYVVSRLNGSAQANSLTDQIATIARSTPPVGESALWTLTLAYSNRSSRELRGVMSQVTDRASWRSAASSYLSMWYPDPATGTVHIGLTAPNATIIDQAHRDFGQSITISVIPRSTNLNREYQSDYPPPWYGGDAIAGTRFCSEAFAVTYQGGYGLLTAGHCEDPGTSVYQEWNFAWSIGTVGWYRYGNNLYDAEFVNAASSAGYVYYSGYSHYNVKGYKQANIGDGVCFDGVVTQQVCTGGVTQREICETTTDGVTHCGMAEVQSIARLAQSGDSGGPVYTVSGGAWAQGLITSCNTAGTDCFMTPVYKIINDGLATLRTT